MLRGRRKKPSESGTECPFPLRQITAQILNPSNMAEYSLFLLLLFDPHCWTPMRCTHIGTCLDCTEATSLSETFCIRSHCVHCEEIFAVLLWFLKGFTRVNERLCFSHLDVVSILAQSPWWPHVSLHLTAYSLTHNKTIRLPRLSTLLSQRFVDTEYRGQ